MTVTLRGETVDLTLNEQLIYHRPLESTNQRTFGLFYFADQTEVRVRAMRLRGDWPKSVPPAPAQQLASQTVSSLNETRASLEAEFSHNFAGASFPAEYFATSPATPSSTQQFIPRADGLFAHVTASEDRRSLWILPRFTIHGDFDIEVSFDQLQLRSDQNAGIHLYTDHVDQQRPHYRLSRMQERDDIERMHAISSQSRPDGSRFLDYHELESCESTSGRLRLARRGETIYYLFADGDSTAFQLIASQPSFIGDTVPGGIQLQADGTGTFDVNVVWKAMAIRAEKLTHLPPD